MVGSVNKTILLGNLGRDPEIRSMQSGAKNGIIFNSNFKEMER